MNLRIIIRAVIICFILVSGVITLFFPEALDVIMAACIDMPDPGEPFDPVVIRKSVYCPDHDTNHTPVNLTQTSSGHSACWFEKIQVEDLDDDNDWGRCKIYEEDGWWKLNCYTDVGSDDDMWCRARCRTWR